MGAIDAFDSWLTQSRSNHRERRAAHKFEQRCRPNHTYYSIVECVEPWGDGLRVDTWRFRKSRLGGLKSGHMTPASVWLGYGPLYDEDPGRHLPRVFEDDDEQAELNLKKAWKAIERRRAA